MSLNLTDLGPELDTIRRARRGEAQSEAQAIPIPAITASPISPASSLSSVASPSVRSRALDSVPDSSAPLCLLCFARPPSAVLLPCCHLNLCYLCAPLFMHKGATASCAVRRVEEEQAARERGDEERERTGRIPFNVALTRAVKGSPGSRRLSIGGYVPPPEGFRGGELRGRDVLFGEKAGLSRARESDGRVVLAPAEGFEAHCLVCRAGVSGWLRVYS
ncbi:hypothetical protein CspeluHIS016_0303160 [Cutaneotrichosporon spelunceum]|uniref:RING-type domain-containing protein n=1 Tax=Cutaneotrichosporon spelunceum TaxID=1672016 RepID=A0AAD3TTZ5_9TREE|nr:hypothetical protein CspeluHIS016_0303160 [Cutaneotrichosporon spelunceum]